MSRRRSSPWRRRSSGRASRLHADVFRPATFIDLALRNITTSLLLGALLVSVILMLFLADLRTAAISLTAIPLSLLSATILLEVLGFSINTLTLGGLAIALGEVVDDAIIDVENIARRLREQGTAVAGDIGEVVVRASLEVRGSVVYATFVVALVFLPGAGAHRRAGRPVPAAGAGLHLRHPRIAHRGAHGDAGALPRPAHPAEQR